MNKVMLFLALTLAAIGFYIMFSMWREFGGTPDTDYMGLYLSNAFWVGAALIVTVDLWRMFGQKVKGYTQNQISSAKSIANRAQKGSKSKKAYEELLKYKTLHETGVITKDEFDQKAQDLKEDLL